MKNQRRHTSRKMLKYGSKPPLGIFLQHWNRTWKIGMQAVESYREKSFLFYDVHPLRPLDDAGTWEQKSGNYERIVGSTGDVNAGLVWDSNTGIWKRYVDGKLVDMGKSYAGGNKGNNPEGINNPLSASVTNVGPPPVGTYVAEQYARPNGSIWVRMWPSSDNQMYGRTLFNIHGDAPPLYDASQGCLIMQLNDRLQVQTGTMIWVE